MFETEIPVENIDKILDSAFGVNPVAHRLLEKCDAILRLQGASKGADEDVRVAKERGLSVHYSLAKMPHVNDWENTFKCLLMFLTMDIGKW